MALLVACRVGSCRVKSGARRQRSSSSSRGFVNGHAKAVCEARSEVALLGPYLDQVADFGKVFRAIGIRSCTADEDGQDWLESGGEGVVSRAELCMVQDVVDDVKRVEAPSLGRRLAAMDCGCRLPAGRGSTRCRLRDVAEGVGQGDQVLGEGGGARRGGDQVDDSPLLAFLRERVWRPGRRRHGRVRLLSPWGHQKESHSFRVCLCGERIVQTWILTGEHWAVAVLRSASTLSISSREHGCGSARNRAPERAALATMSSVDAMASQSSSWRLDAGAKEGGGFVEKRKRGYCGTIPGWFERGLRP